MLTTLDRYLLKEVLQTWLAVTVVLLLIMLSQRFARYLGEAAAGQLPPDVVFTLLGLTSIHYMTVLVPVSLFLAVMLALGRLYKDSEMAALMACGVGYGRLLRPLVAMALAFAAGLAFLSMWVSPWAAQATLPAPDPLDLSALGPPVPAPRQVFAAGLNYRDHAAEAGMPLPDEPMRRRVVAHVETL
jgi:hypothetical protein